MKSPLSVHFQIDISFEIFSNMRQHYGKFCGNSAIINEVIVSQSFPSKLLLQYLSVHYSVYSFISLSVRLSHETFSEMVRAVVTEFGENMWSVKCTTCNELHYFAIKGQNIACYMN